MRKSEDLVFPKLQNEINIDSFIDVSLILAQICEQNSKFCRFWILKNRQVQSKLWKLVTESEVNGILTVWRARRQRTRSEDLSSKLTKLVALAIVSALTKLINICSETGYFRESMNVAKVLSVYETWDINAFENYGRVSLLPVISKILETVIYNRMAPYICRFILLTSCQIGFRHKFKTIDSLACVTEQIRILLTAKRRPVVFLLFWKKRSTLSIMLTSLIISNTEASEVR